MFGRSALTEDLLRGRESGRQDRGPRLTTVRAVSSAQDGLLDELRDGLRAVVGHLLHGVGGWPEAALFVEFGFGAESQCRIACLVHETAPEEDDDLSSGFRPARLTVVELRQQFWGGLGHDRMKTFGRGAVGLRHVRDLRLNSRRI